MHKTSEKRRRVRLNAGVEKLTGVKLVACKIWLQWNNEAKKKNEMRANLQNEMRAKNGV
jgi:hypothetical protein